MRGEKRPNTHCLYMCQILFSVFLLYKYYSIIYMYQENHTAMRSNIHAVLWEYIIPIVHHIVVQGAIYWPVHDVPGFMVYTFWHICRVCVYIPGCFFLPLRMTWGRGYTDTYQATECVWKEHCHGSTINIMHCHSNAQEKHPSFKKCRKPLP